VKGYSFWSQLNWDSQKGRLRTTSILVRTFSNLGKCTKRPISTFGCTFSAFFGFWVFSFGPPLETMKKKVVSVQIWTSHSNSLEKRSICWEFHYNRLKIEKTAAKCANRPFYAFPQILNFRSSNTQKNCSLHNLDTLKSKNHLNHLIIYWPNSLDCTDLNQCGVRRDAELCRLCYKLERTLIVGYKWVKPRMHTYSILEWA
jgi:hypothetical protein